MKNWLLYKEVEPWIDRMRGTMSLLASTNTSLAYNLLVNPSGGIVRATINDSE